MVDPCLKEIDVVILAGGMGTRLAKKLNGKPKILAPILGKTFLDFIFCWLRNYGVQNIILALGHLADEVQEYLKTAPPEDINIKCVIDSVPLGTVGGVVSASYFIQSELVLVMNGDTFIDADLCKFREYHRKNSTEITLLTTKVENSSRYGLVDIDELGFVKSFKEKTGSTLPGVINSGLYFMGKSVISYIKEQGTGSLETEVFQKLPHGSIGAFNGEFNFIDIGIPETYLKAEPFLTPYSKRWTI